jgi:hypothetical protein
MRAIGDGFHMGKSQNRRLFLECQVGKIGTNGQIIHLNPKMWAGYVFWSVLYRVRTRIVRDVSTMDASKCNASLYREVPKHVVVERRGVATDDIFDAERPGPNPFRHITATDV